MENLEFESINNFRIASSVDSIVGNIESSKTSTIEKDVGYDDDYIVQSKTTSFMWIGTIILSFFIWIICIISLILNCVRKNVGKAIFSGIGIAVPIISMIISTIGRTLVLVEEETELGMFLGILAIVLEIIVGIISFIFLFSKDKRKM
jgi:hypothetical protein